MIIDDKLIGTGGGALCGQEIQGPDGGRNELAEECSSGITHSPRELWLLRRAWELTC